MVNWELCGEITAMCGDVAKICVTGALYQRFAGHFAREDTHGMAGAAYALVMLVFNFYPPALDGRLCYGIGIFVFFLVMYALDRRNREQKIFLAVTLYLLDWIAWGVSLGPWGAVYEAVVLNPAAAERHALQFALFVAMAVMYVAMDTGAVALLLGVIRRAYHDKGENMTKKELVLLLAPSLSVLGGYWFISYVGDVYEKDCGRLIWDENPEYIWLRALYMAAAFGALLAALLSYQRIRDVRRREKEDAVLFRQMEDMKRHIGEVETLYLDIRRLKHDMANHIMLLEELCAAGQAGKDKGESAQAEGAEAAEYMARLKGQMEETALGIRSGNPVTDVLLREKCREAQERGIRFRYDFHYPEGTKAEAFDVSIILCNAIDNAMEAAAECGNPYIEIVSGRRKNAYLIEVRNSVCGIRAVDRESGLPPTTKEGAGHGFGLVNIRKVAGKYHGDIEIWQDGKEFVLSVMLMTEG